MLDYVATTGCRMRFLRAQLDDPALPDGWTCGRCDRCGGVTLPPPPDAATVANAREEMDRPGVEVEPRKMWPSGLATLGLDVKGKIPEAERAEPGRAVARFDGLGWSGPVRELFAPTTPDGETPNALRTAAARVLDDWDAIRTAGGADEGSGATAEAGPERRLVVEGVVAVRSVTRPRLTYHLANGLASYLGVPLIGAVGPAPGAEEPGRHDVNSAMRLAGVVQRLRLELGEAALAGLPGRTVLLVDDWTESGWTLTVAARLLRQAGAAGVYPFVLGVR